MNILLLLYGTLGRMNRSKIPLILSREVEKDGKFHIVKKFRRRLKFWYDPKACILLSLTSILSKGPFCVKKRAFFYA